MTYHYRVSKIVDAPVDRVWQAWTTAEGTAGIFRARPETVSLDPRPGGKFTVAMTLPDGAQETMTGTYLELVPNQRLVTTMDTPQGPTSPMVMDLEEVTGEQTLVTFTQSCPDAELRDASREGSEILLSWVAAHLAQN